MIEEINALENEERDLMYKAPILVAILVAGADGNIDRAEIKEAISISSLKKVKARKALKDYYTEVGEHFEDKLKHGITTYPSDVGEREKMISAELEQLNAVLPKLDSKFAVEFHASLKDFAKRVAEASGGIFGYMSVGYEESKLVDLKMIKDPSTT